MLRATLVGETDWSIIFDLFSILVCLVLLQTRVVCLIVAANLMLEVGYLAAAILPHRIIVSPLLLDICLVLHNWEPLRRVRVILCH